jgi:hypothetical protein
MTEERRAGHIGTEAHFLSPLWGRLEPRTRIKYPMRFGMPSGSRMRNRGAYPGGRMRYCSGSPGSTQLSNDSEILSNDRPDCSAGGAGRA